jgi:hypothetical protein
VRPVLPVHRGAERGWALMKRWFLVLEKVDRREVIVEAASEEAARTVAEDGAGELARDDEEGLWVCRHCEAVEEDRGE